MNMEDYRILFHLVISHEYFDGKGGDFFEVRLTEASLMLLKSRQLLFKREGENCWSLLGNVEGGGVYGDCDRLELEFVLTDPAFQYYTEWANYNREVVYDIILSGHNGKLRVPDIAQEIQDRKKRAGVFFTGELRLSEQMFERARGDEYDRVELCFSSKEMFWEYWFVPRKEDTGELRLVLEEQNGRLMFSEPERVSSSFIGRAVYRCISLEVVQMKSDYSYRLDLSEVIRENPTIRRKVVKDVEYPVPGEFYDLPGDVLRRIVYF